MAGLAAAWLLDLRERERRPRAYRDARGARARPSRDEPAARVSRLLRENAHAEAAQEYFSGGERLERELAPEDAFELARWLEENGHARAALSVFRRVLRRHRLGPVAAEAHLGAGLVQLRSLGRPASAWQHFLDAIDLDPHGEAAARARRGLRAIEALQGFGRLAPEARRCATAALVATGAPSARLTPCPETESSPAPRPPATSPS